jgi:iron(III) transport system ATP-binding protein
MTVAENVAFPFTVARHKRYTRAEIADGVKRALATVDLDGFQERSATRLSGGQQQRVALARAIVHEPRLLLLDEPLSNLDAQLRDDMRGELKRLQSKIGITTVYVTHDQSEALALSDRIAVIDQGRITQIGTPHDIYFRPANPFVARFVGATNLLAGRLIGSSDGRGEVDVLGGRRIRCLVPQGIEAAAAVSVSIRPESIQLVLPGSSANGKDNCLAGRISGVTFLGAACRVDVMSDGVSLHVTTPADMTLPADGEVLLLFPPERTVALPGGCRKRIASRRTHATEFSHARSTTWLPKNTRRSWSRRAKASLGSPSTGPTSATPCRRSSISTWTTCSTISRSTTRPRFWW